MKKWGSIWRVGLVLILLALTLTGCGRRAIFDRANESATEAITIEMQPQDTSSQTAQDQAQAESMAESPAQTPTQTPKQPTADAGAPDLNKLMDELETALDELDETIKQTDSDALTDAALAALGK